MPLDRTNARWEPWEEEVLINLAPRKTYKEIGKMILIRAGPGLLDRYRSWLEERGYTYDTIDRNFRCARRLIRAFPGGVPFDEETLVREAGTWGNMKPTKRTYRNSARRFFEFLDREIAQNSQGGERA